MNIEHRISKLKAKRIEDLGSRIECNVSRIKAYCLEWLAAMLAVA